MYGSGVWFTASLICGGVFVVGGALTVWAALREGARSDEDLARLRRHNERAARNGIGRPRSGNVSNVVPAKRRPVCVVVESSFESPTETMLQYRRRIDEHPDGAA